MKENDQKIFEIISKYTDLDISELNQNTSTENTPEWDSLAQMQILNDLSRIYSFELKPENIINLNSFLSIRDYLLKFEK